MRHQRDVARAAEKALGYILGRRVRVEARETGGMPYLLVAAPVADPNLLVTAPNATTSRVRTCPECGRPERDQNCPTCCLLEAEGALR